MNFIRNGLVLSICTVSAFLACAATPTLPPASTQQGVTFDKDIRPIFETSCLQCHGEVKPKEGLRLDSRESVLKGAKHGQVVVPGQSEKSLLVVAVARVDPQKAMPPKAKAQKPNGQNNASKKPAPKPLTVEQVALVRAWIDQGAK